MIPISLGIDTEPTNTSMDSSVYCPNYLPNYYAINHEDFKTNILEQYYNNDDSDVDLLWDIYIGCGETEYKYAYLNHIDSMLITNDNIPDILAGMYAIDGLTGEIIYQFERGVFLCLGDVNNDGQIEIITGNKVDMLSDIFCINASDGSLIWEYTGMIEHILDSVSIGNVTGDSTNEIVFGMDDVYCFNGIDGSIIWSKHLSSSTTSEVAIFDVNNDGYNEVVTSIHSNDGRIYCLNGDNGDVIWEFSESVDKYPSFRTICIDNLNDDPYMEIVLEGNSNGNYKGVFCLSGYDGDVLWDWSDDSLTGSFQAILTADLISSIPGKEIIAGGVGGLYCLYGGDNPPPAGRVIWHTITGIIMTAVVGDIDGDGLLDVVGSSCGFIGTGGGSTYALKGQYGSLLWKYKNGGNDFQDSTICVDLDNDFIDEVFSLNEFYDERRLYNVSALKSDFPSDNNAPEIPIIDGSTEGNIRTTYTYSAVSNDADGDDLYYYFDWGDGTGNISEVSGSGELVSVSHRWGEQGNFTIRVKTIDEHGAESDWSYLEISMPKIKTFDDFNPWILRLIQRFPIFKFLL